MTKSHAEGTKGGHLLKLETTVDGRQHAEEFLHDLGSRICLEMAYIAALGNTTGLEEGKYDKIAETVSYMSPLPKLNPRSMDHPFIEFTHHWQPLDFH
jgi:hypothetical protein